MLLLLRISPRDSYGFSLSFAQGHCIQYRNDIIFPAADWQRPLPTSPGSHNNCCLAVQLVRLQTINSTSLWNHVLQNSVPCSLVSLLPVSPCPTLSLHHLCVSLKFLGCLCLMKGLGRHSFSMSRAVCCGKRETFFPIVCFKVGQQIQSHTHSLIVPALCVSGTNHMPQYFEAIFLQTLYLLVMMPRPIKFQAGGK